MSQLGSQPRFGALQIGIILLTVATAAIHAWLGFGFLFYANAVGYLGLLGLLYLPLPMVAPHRGLVRWALIVFTAITLLAWVIMGTRDTLAYVTKVIEVALIVLLFMEVFIEGRQTQA